MACNLLSTVRGWCIPCGSVWDVLSFLLASVLKSYSSCAGKIMRLSSQCRGPQCKDEITVHKH